MSAPPATAHDARPELPPDHGLPDAAEEALFDQLARLAARLCGMPMAAIGFLGTDGAAGTPREWCKAACGLPRRALDGASPFFALAHEAGASSQESIVVVADASAHALLRTHALVQAPYRVRAVACVPLFAADGVTVLGAVTAMDPLVRDLQPPQQEALQIVARQVMAQLELRRARNAAARLALERDGLAAQLQMQGGVLRDLSLLARAGSWQVELPSRVLTWSQELASTFELEQQTLPVEDSFNLYPPGIREQVEAAFERCASEGTPMDMQVPVCMPDSRRYRLRMVAHAVRDGEGRIVRVHGTFLDVSDSHAAQAARAASDERFRLVAHATTDAVWDWDMQSDAVWWNEGMEKLFGVPRHLLPPDSTSWTQRLHPDDCPWVMGSIRTVLEGQGDSWSAEYRFRRFDGSYAWVSDRGFIIRDSKGRAVRMVGGMADVSAQKEAALQAEQDARAQAEMVREQQRLASANLPEAQILQLAVDAALVLTQADAAVLELAEDGQMRVRARAQASQSGLGPLVGQATPAKNDAEDGMHFLAVPLNAGSTLTGRLRVLQSVGGAFTPRQAVHLQTLADSLGATLQLRDIEARLRASEAQYRSLFADHPQPMWVYECDSLRILAVNRAMVQLHGYSEAELMRMAMPDLFLPEERDRLAAVLRDMTHDGRPEPLRQRHVRRDGRVIDMEMYSGSTRFNGVAACQVLGNDVTERVRTERELARVGRAQRLLGECNEILVRATSEAELLHAVCRVAVEIGGYRLGWVGMARDDPGKSIDIVAHAGHEEHFLEALHLSWSADHPGGQGPAGQCVRSGRTAIVHDVRKATGFAHVLDRMQAHGLRAAICLPLCDTQRTFGLLYLYASELVHLSAEEAHLLESLANDVAFGIKSLRARTEQQHLQAMVLKVASAVSAGIGAEFFQQLVVNMSDVLGAPLAGVARLLPVPAGETPRASTMAWMLDGALQPPLEYDLVNMPSERLLTQRHVLVPEQVSQRFAYCTQCAELGMEGYVGHQLSDSEGRPVGLIFVVFREPLTRPDFMLHTMQIFAARASAEVQRQIADSRIRQQASLLDKARDAIIVRDLNHRITFWNQGAEHMYGWTRQEAMGRSIAELLYRDPEAFHYATQATLDHGEWTGEILQYDRHGTPLEVEGRWTLVRADDGTPESVLALNTDIRQRKATEREIQRLAFYDPLTGLPNRMLLMDRIGQALTKAQRQRQGGALLFIDLDNFKTLNDTLGHDKGDLLLQQVAKRLNTCVRSVDTVARLGGDEFVVMIEELSNETEALARHARSVGEKVLTVLSAPYALAGYQYRSTPSIGIAPFDDAPSSVGELLKQADLAMYQAKTAGRNTLRFFDPGMQAVVSARALLEADLRAALSQDEFTLHYQPQVDHHGHIVGLEALLRWSQPQRGMVSPGEFIPLAEETGLILPLGRWVLHTACKLLASWRDEPDLAHLTMAVNVSSRQFRHASFVDDVARVLAITGAPSTQLKLELTETLLVEDMETTIATMTALRTYGVRFSLDDFGTGYSSLSYLKRMPLDQLKIDQSFVADLLTDPNDAAIVDTIIALSRSLGLQVIAEGVETADQRERLAQAGCRYYQGYLFSRPLSMEALDRLLHPHQAR